MERIIYIGELDRTKSAPDHLGIRQGLESFNGLVVDPVLNDKDTIIKQVKRFKPDLIIHGNTDSLGQGLGTAIKEEVECKQVFWMLDYQPTKELYSSWDIWLQDKGAYDAIFLSNKDQLDMWSEDFDCPTYYLTHGCVVQPLVKDESKNMDVVFIGSHNNGGWYNDRYFLLEELKKLYPFNIHTGSDVDSRNKVWDEMPAIYHSSNCVIDVSHSWEADGYASGRYFYSAGLGGCSITKRFPGCEELYPSSCKAYFDTPEEAVELIKYYKSHEKEREEMKVNAWEWNKKHHHYKLKFEEIISKLC